MALAALLEDPQDYQEEVRTAEGHQVAEHPETEPQVAALQVAAHQAVEHLAEEVETLDSASTMSIS